MSEKPYDCEYCGESHAFHPEHCKPKETNSLAASACSPLRFHATITAELKVDCYDGENFDEHRKYWNAYCEGDKQDEDIDGHIEFSPAMFPPGTRITIEEPLCPKCEELHDCCSCGFDWAAWAADRYA